MKSSNSPHQGFWRAPLKSDWIWMGNWWKKCLKVLLWRRNLTDRNWKSHDFLPKYYIETHWSNSLNFYRIQSNLHGGEECDGKDVDFHEKRGRMRNTSKAAEHVVRILDELFMKETQVYLIQFRFKSRRCQIQLRKKNRKKTKNSQNDDSGQK